MTDFDPCGLTGGTIRVTLDGDSGTYSVERVIPGGSIAWGYYGLSWEQVAEVLRGKGYEVSEEPLP